MQIRCKRFVSSSVLLSTMKMIATLLAMACSLLAQTPNSVLGTVSAMHPDTAEFEIKPETGVPVVVKLSGATLMKKVAPGQTDLAKAETIAVTDVAIGDRVLVTVG